MSAVRLHCDGVGAEWQQAQYHEASGAAHTDTYGVAASVSPGVLYTTRAESAPGASKVTMAESTFRGLLLTWMLAICGRVTLVEYTR